MDRAVRIRCLISVNIGLKLSHVQRFSFAMMTLVENVPVWRLSLRR